MTENGVKYVLNTEHNGVKYKAYGDIETERAGIQHGVYMVCITRITTVLVHVKFA